MSLPAFQGFDDFWPFYLGEHAHPTNRALHVVGTTTAMLWLLGSLATASFVLAPLALVLGYGPAWIGHFFVEGNKPASFEHPLWSFLGDMKMVGLALTGRLGAEVERLGIEAPA